MSSGYLPLPEAIEHLYLAFERYSDWSRKPGCPCCHRMEYLDALIVKPLRGLTHEDFERYSDSPALTWDNVDDFRHFLPRLIELSTLMHLRPHTLPLSLFWENSTIFEILRTDGWRAWPITEQTAIDEFLHSWWRTTLDTPPLVTSASEVLNSLAEVYEDLAPFLITWRDNQSRSALQHFGESWSSLPGGRSSLRFYGGQCLEWLCDQATKRWLLEGYLQFAKEDWADSFAAELDVVLTLTPTAGRRLSGDSQPAPLLDRSTDRYVAGTPSMRKKSPRRPKDKTRRIGRE